MSQPAPAPMTVDEYYAWGELQEDRYELVDGFPVRMMSGASRRHDQIVINLLGELRNCLRGTACRPFTADTAVATTARQRRRPDAGVECGELRDADYVANDPRAVVEVLSPSTRLFDLLGKLDEYRAVASLREIVVIEPDAPEARVWSRDEAGEWRGREVEGLDAALELASLGITLPLREVYEGLDFRPRPQLVTG